MTTTTTSLTTMTKRITTTATTTTTTTTTTMTTTTTATTGIPVPALPFDYLLKTLVSLHCDSCLAISIRCKQHTSSRIYALYINGVSVDYVITEQGINLNIDSCRIFRY